MVQTNTGIASYTLDIFFPIGNVFRSIGYGLNLYWLGCRGNDGLVAPGSWYRYDFRVTYLIIPITLLGVLLVWLDGDLSFSMFQARPRSDPALGATLTDTRTSAVAK